MRTGRGLAGRGRRARPRQQQRRAQQLAQVQVAGEAAADVLDWRAGRLQVAEVAVDVGVAWWLQLHRLLQSQPGTERLELLGAAAHHHRDQAVIVPPGVDRLGARRPVGVGDLVQPVQQQPQRVLLDPLRGRAAGHLVGRCCVPRTQGMAKP
jgi:hypothetical protein